MVVGSNFARNEFNFIVAKISFGMEMKRQSNPSCQEAAQAKRVFGFKDTHQT